MINHNNLRNIANNLEDIIGTPVSEQILANCSESQRKLLTKLINDYTLGNDVNATILSILNYGKSKLKPRIYSDKTNFYLANKLK